MVVDLCVVILDAVEEEVASLFQEGINTEI